MALQFFEIWTILLSTGLLIFSLRNLSNTKHAIYFIHLLFYFIFVLPLVLDYVWAKPDYHSAWSNLQGFEISYNDERVRFIYACYILLSQLIMLYFGKKRGKNRKLEKINYSDQSGESIDRELLERDSILITRFLFFGSIITLLLVLVLPISKSILWSFGWRDIGVEIRGMKYYSTIEKMSYISIVSAVLYIGIKNKTSAWIKVFSLLLVVSAACVESKRSIILFIFVLLVSYYIYSKRGKIPLKFYIVLLSLLLISIFLSVYIKTEYRGYSDYNMIYTTLRIDFFRDDRVKMVIYSLLHQDVISILSYPGQSILTQLGALFPFQFLGVNVVGYNAFFSSALSGYAFDPGYAFMTTSIFDETLANFGFYGVWIAPVVCVLFARIADKQNRMLVPITISAILLLFMFPPIYIMWFLQFWLAAVVFEKVRTRKVISN